MKGKIELQKRIDMLGSGCLVVSKDPIGQHKLGKTTGIYDINRDQCIIEDYYDPGHAWGAKISELYNFVIVSKELEHCILLTQSDWASALKRRLAFNHKTIEFKYTYPPPIHEEHPAKRALDDFRDRLKVGTIIRKKMYSQKQVDEMISKLTLTPYPNPNN